MGSAGCWRPEPGRARPPGADDAAGVLGGIAGGAPSALAVGADADAGADVDVGADAVGIARA